MNISRGIRDVSSPNQSSLSGFTRSLAIAAGYGAVAVAIVAAWSVRDRNLIRADEGLGYWLGIVGATLMLLLLVYPLRKRIRSLGFLGSIRFWFRTHMIFGILGPLFVLFHSNFNLGSPNGRLALFCTMIVASSGLLGRYLYGKIHYGMYGQRATLTSLQADVSREGSSDLLRSINAVLAPYEERVMAHSGRWLRSVADVIVAPFTVVRLKRRLEKQVAAKIAAQGNGSSVDAAHRERLAVSAERYLDGRLVTYRKFAQLRGCERLFGLWHVVHFPLFLVMVVTAIVHVFAVHAY